MRADIGWTPTFADAGMLLDLTKYFPADFQKQFLPAPMGTAIYKSGMYGVPQVTDALGLLCNKTLLTAAGLTAAPTSWDELVTAGQKVTDLAAKKYGFYMNGDSYWSQSFIWGWGGTLFTVNDQGKITNIGVNSPESVNGWTYLHDKVLGTVAPKTWDFKTSYDNMNAGFKAGTTMCIMQGPWQVADILKGTAFTDKSNLVIAPIPTGVQGKTGSPVGGHNWVVSLDVGKDANKAAAVASFLTYMTDPQPAGRPGQEPRPAPDQHRRLRRPGRGERPAHQPVERRPGRRDEPCRRARRRPASTTRSPRTSRA